MLLQLSLALPGGMVNQVLKVHIKRLDRVLMAESLMEKVHNYRTWVTSLGILDHLPISL